MPNNLLEKSEIYYKNSEIYEIFAQAEDKPNYIYNFLKDKIKNKYIIDMGCGTGKYVNLFAPLAKSIFAFDASQMQLNIAIEKNRMHKNVLFKSQDASQIKLTKKYDIIFSSWMLSTITDLNKRKLILDNMKQNLASNGKIIFVENDYGGEFEELRGRVDDPKNRTCNYNKWLIDNGFKVTKKIDTYFEFSSLEEAKYIIKSIWGDKAESMLKEKIISHKVIVFELDSF